MKASRSDLMRKILLTLDHSPASIYDLLYSIENLSDPKRTRLPKLLKKMEKEKLVVSALQPGPLGPYRRIYQPGPEAEEYLIETLRGGFETLLHFYNDYRKENPGQLYNLGKEEHQTVPEGNVLYLAYPSINVDDVDEIRDLVSSNDVNISISGADAILTKTGINYSIVNQKELELQAGDNTFSQIRIKRTPPMVELPKIISECKRVLKKGGLLNIKTAYVFFDKPKKASLAEFIRDTAQKMFPDLGIIEGDEINSILKQNFTEYGSYETNLGEVVFWAVK